MMRVLPKSAQCRLQFPFVRFGINRSPFRSAASAGAGIRLCVYSSWPLCTSGNAKQQDSPPSLLKAAFCQIRTSTLSSACIGTISTPEVKSCMRSTPNYVQSSVKAERKGKGLLTGTVAHPDQELSVDNNAGKIKVAVSNAFACTFDHNGESQATNQKCESSIENETVAHIPLQACEEEQTVDNESCAADGKDVDSSSTCKEREEIDSDAFVKNVKISRHFKKNTEAFVKLNSCSKFADLHGAIELYDQVKKEGLVQLGIQNYNVLLYICSGAASGSLVKSKLKKEGKKQDATSLQSNQVEYNKIEGLEEDTKELVRFSLKDMELAARRGAEILEDMLQEGIEPNEATFTSIIRFAVARNDGDLAFETIKLMVSSGITPKLRSYSPPLLCFCENKKVDKAFEVDDHMQKFGVLPDESMLNSLLRVSIEAQLEKKVYSLLQRLRMSVRDLMPTTVQTIEKWFKSEMAFSLGKANWETSTSKDELRRAMEACGGGWHGLGWLGKGAWQVKRTNISKTGSCLSCGEKLCTIDLDPSETEKFANSIAEIATQRQQQSQGFRAFQEWLDRNGPFDAIVDGANVGLYNPQVFRGFSFTMLNAVMKAASSKIATRRPPLFILNTRHQPQLARTKAEQQIKNKWMKEKSMYFTPRGSNDDWFWLYAAVKCRCLLITNDNMHDHIFDLLGTDFFPKWKERHQVRFTFVADTLELHMPPPYSVVIQESQNGSWHIPEVGGDDIEEPREWLCVTRAEAFPSVQDST